MNPSSTDRVTQQIQSKLGDYQRVQPYLDDSKRLIGVDGVPPSPACPSAPSSSSRPNVNPSLVLPSRLQPPPDTRPEFKKPPQNNGRPHQQPHQRRDFVKPSDGKPPYEGRGGYPGQPIKPSGSISNHRVKGIGPVKPPPPQSTNSSSSSSSQSNSGSSRIHATSRNLPRISLDQVSR